MIDHTFVPSILQIKSTASLQEQVAKELQIPDPNKTIAELLQNNEEKENEHSENTK